MALIHSYQALGTLEWHSPHWDIYTNVGGEYAQRTIYGTGASQFGYGRTVETSTGSCLVEQLPSATGGGTKIGFTPFTPSSSACNDPRNIIEGTFGVWYKPYSGPKGRIQFGPQYSYIVLNTWWDSAHLPGTGTTPLAPTPHAVENMFFTSFRYYLP